MAKKLALIDPDLLIRLLEKFQHSTTNTSDGGGVVHAPVDPRLKKMHNIDKEMTFALEKQSSKTSPDDSSGEHDAFNKLQHYNDMLQMYRTHGSQYIKDNTNSAPWSTKGKTRTAEKEEEQDSGDKSRMDNWEDEILANIPKTQKLRASALLRRIKNSGGKLGWNSKGQMTYNKVPIAKTNIVDLVSDIIRQRKTVDAPPGHELFATTLREINTPRELIGNKARMRLVYGQPDQKEQEEQEEETEEAIYARPSLQRRQSRAVKTKKNKRKYSNISVNPLNKKLTWSTKL